MHTKSIFRIVLQWATRGWSLDNKHHLECILFLAFDFTMTKLPTPQWPFATQCAQWDRSTIPTIHHTWRTLSPRGGEVQKLCHCGDRVRWRDNRLKNHSCASCWLGKAISSYYHHQSIWSLRQVVVVVSDSDWWWSMQGVFQTLDTVWLLFM